MTLSPTETNEAAAAAAVAAKAVVAAAASLLEHQRQQAQKQQHQQQAPQQRGQQQQRLHRQQQPLQQKREQHCLPSLGPGMVSEEREAESEQLRLLSRVAHLSRFQADEGDATTSCVPTNAVCSDAAAGAASDAAAASPTTFGGRAGIRSRTAPASSLDDKTMP
ncbi:uncharacterized protein, partial [Physeter macrocephalus]|uniref:Uncharacterized protein n=1 Tax=Physeter macrocephalus TaxID=9755 RepID=A0A9W2WK78_PHYMC